MKMATQSISSRAVRRAEAPLDPLEALSRLDAPNLDLTDLASSIHRVLCQAQLATGTLLSRSGAGGVEVLHQDLEAPGPVHSRLLRMLERPNMTDVDVVLAPYRFRISPLGAPAQGAPFALVIQPGARFQANSSSAMNLAVSLLRMKVASLPGNGERRPEPRLGSHSVHFAPEDVSAGSMGELQRRPMMPIADRKAGAMTTARLAHLYQILRLLEPSQTPSDIARTLLPYLADFVAFDVAGLLLTERGKATTTLMAGRPCSRLEEQAFVADLITSHASQSPAPPAIESCEEQILSPSSRRGEDGLPSDPADAWEVRVRNVGAAPKVSSRALFASRLSLPIITRSGRFVGQLAIGSRAPERYGEDELVLLSGLVSYLSSLLDSRRLFLELEHQAKVDEMTELYNYRTFRQLLSAELSRAARYGKQMSVVMIDVDHFKSVNDTYGHPRGDEVLRAVARVLDKARRRVDIVARYGGEEFALILPETGPEGAKMVAERIRKAIERTKIMKERPVTISAGVATFSGQKGRTDETLIARADAALYKAKKKGRNRVETASGK